MSEEVQHQDAAGNDIPEVMFMLHAVVEVAAAKLRVSVVICGNDATKGVFSGRDKTLGRLHRIETEGPMKRTHHAVDRSLLDHRGADATS